MTGDEGQIVIARHATGAVANPEQLNQKISEAWGSLIADPEEKASIARSLGVKEDEIRPDSPPFEASGGPSGIIETTIFILVAKGFLGGIGAAAGKTTFDYLRSLWTKVAQPLEDPRT